MMYRSFAFSAALISFVLLSIPTVSTAQIQGTWQTGPSMPTTRYNHAATTIGGKLYVVGGWDGSRQPLATLEIYDPATNAWTTGPAMATARIGHAAAEIGGKLYVVGAWDKDWNPLATLEIFNPATDTWTTGPDMPTVRGDLAAAEIGGKLYVVGGYDGSQRLATLEIYDPVTNAWTTGPAMPTARSSRAAAAIDGKLYVVGGFDGSRQPLATLEIYDPATNAWTTGPSMPTALYAHSVAEIGGKLYVVGNYSPNNLVIFDPTTNAWAIGPDMPTARFLHAAAAIDGRLYVVGRYTYIDFRVRHLNTLEIYETPYVSGTIFTTTWTAAKSPYLVNGTITVPEDNTLTIEAGVDVLFDADVQFIVEGALRVHGTESDSVRFFKGEAGQWRGIRISGGDSSYFSYTRISDGNARGDLRESAGGALYVSGDGTRVTMDNSVIAGNNADGFGGGLFNDAFATVKLTRCVITRNASASRGGGLANFNPGSTMELTNCTITGNTAGDFGGGLANYVGTTTLANSIVWGNSAPEYAQIVQVDGSVTVRYSNVQGGIRGGVTDGSNNIDADPLFVDASKGDFRLSEGSPCIDTGDPESGLDPDGTRADMGALYFHQGTFGEITTATWTAKNSPYRITGTIIIPSGEILTIRPGVDVFFDIDVQFIVEGALRVHGTEYDSVRFLKCAADAWGGIRITGGDSSAFLYTRISDGYARGDSPDSHGGGLFVDGEGTELTMEECVISGNTAASSGGGLYINGSATLTNGTIRGNSARDGGGLRTSGSPTIESCVIIENTATRNGGGLYHWESGGLFVMTNSTISFNSAQDGGGLYRFGGTHVPTFVVQDCVISWNTATSNGGGLYNFSGRADMNHCVVVKNTASRGGGFYNDSQGQLYAVHCTITGNTASSGSGLYGGVYRHGTNLYRGSYTFLMRCILWGNTGGSQIVLDIQMWRDPFSGVYMTERAELNAQYSNIQGGYSGTGNINADPLFIDAPNGDYRLSEDSPCIGEDDTYMGAIPFESPESIAVSLPLSFSLAQNAPNPFNPITTLRFSVEVDGPAKLLVYDVCGRLVRTLVDGNLSAGHHEVVWDARDNVGRAVASGVYVYQLTSGENAAMRRMVLVR